MSQPLLAVDHLAKSYGGVRAVKGVTFTVPKGEIVALIGPNGAGKSTCFNMLNGQIAPDSGAVRLNGADITGLEPRKVWAKGVGRTFQITATFSSMSVRENVQVALLSVSGESMSLFGRARNKHIDEAEALLALVGLADQAGRPCGELAYGDLKRLELAVALANRPQLLLMDEPTAGMAPAERITLMRLMAEIAKDRAMGVLFTEHDMDVVFEHADHVLVLNRGTLIARGTPQEVRNDPQVQAVYLGEGLVYAGEGAVS
jgi:branched-chain amino acid transport system ATP-binding protein